MISKEKRAHAPFKSSLHPRNKLRERYDFDLLTNMIYESRRFGKQCSWFTSLVSKEANLPQIYKVLDVVQAKSIKTIDMSQGNKISRIVAWSFG
ncbi:RlmF-related methyltransferase [Belliella pelovolcani]|uniref:23S rRNA (Adenine1618-N6)-methyltransferase n=1 Tax=Belliella pelovolcani TaxID=529505 RepID=A0A1N7P5H9_9BACT|nr:RlmF-related methyltransferase [Belliella pelovolcani]SIT05800.1 23S rRNA (adenine1618-N6)-methyltransferase [Belliella pelovolcani]